MESKLCITQGFTLAVNWLTCSLMTTCPLSSQVKDGAQRHTHFEISTTQASRLPVVDFAAFDLAGELEVEIGEVCFW